MSPNRILLCLIFPPFSVLDKGLVAIIVVTICSVFGVWVGGIIPAILINLYNPKK